MRFTEVFQTIPHFLLVIVLVALLQPSTPIICAAIAIVSWPPVARLVRGQFLTLRQRAFVESCVVIGMSTPRIIFTQILPNCIAPIIVTGSIMVASAILIEAGLSFLGLGDPNSMSWGAMIGFGRQSLRTALVPGRDSRPRDPAHRARDQLRQRRPERRAQPPPRMNASASPALLEVDHLVVESVAGAAPVRLVDDVSFRLDVGGTLAIVGESGCGKSLTALSLLRILPEPGVKLSEGSIRLSGEDLAKASEARMCQVRNGAISMIFQDPIASLNPVQTVGQQIVEAIRSHRDVGRREARQQAIELLKSVHLPDPETRIDYYPHRLSGGMCQRVMIAMALASHPRILIADEPTTALDTTVQAQVMALLKKAQRDTGTAVVLITHNLAVAADAARHVAVMYAGRIVESGPVRQVFRTPMHPYTRGLLAAIPTGEETGEDGEIPRLVEIPGTVPRPGSLAAGCAFARALPAPPATLHRGAARARGARGAGPRRGLLLSPRGHAAMSGALLSCRDVAVEFRVGRQGAARGRRRRYRRRAGDHGRGRRRVGLRQVHAGARHHGPRRR